MGCMNAAAIVHKILTVDVGRRWLPPIYTRTVAWLHKLNTEASVVCPSHLASLLQLPLRASPANWLLQ